MALFARFKWCLFGLGLIFAYWLSVELYWLPDRFAWQRAHPHASAAYGEGKLIARAVISSAGPALITALCFLFVPAPRTLIAIALGVISGILAFALQVLFWDTLGSRFGFRAAVHAPVILATLFVVAGFMIAGWRKASHDDRPTI